MRHALIALLMLAGWAFAQERPVDIDPNTKTEGGADLRGSGAKAGEQRDTKSETAKPVPDKEASEKDKPISARKPREEREPQDAAKGATTAPR